MYPNNGGQLTGAYIWRSDFSVPSSRLFIHDLNKDGGLDFVIGCLSYINSGSPPMPQVAYYDDNGPPTMPNWYSPATLAFSATGGDPDGDGDMDIVFSQGDHYSNQPRRKGIFFNVDGQLKTTPSWETDDAYYATDVDFVDLDNDGDLDLIMTGNPLDIVGPFTVAVFTNNDGVLETSPSWTTPSIDAGILSAFADVDGDGHFDMVVANWNSGGGYFLFMNYGGTLETTPSWSCFIHDVPACVTFPVDRPGGISASHRYPVPGAGCHSLPRLGVRHGQGARRCR